MKPLDPIPLPPEPGSTRRALSFDQRHRNRRNAGPGNGLIRVSHALEPALRAAKQWRDAACELERLDRAHQRRRAAIVARQQRASTSLAAFMANTGANREWLTGLLNLPDHAVIDAGGGHDGQR